jgi:hypothetical protein
MLMVARYGVKIILTVEEQHSHLVCQLVVVKILAALVAPIAVMNDIEMTDMIIIRFFEYSYYRLAHGHY